MGNERPVHVIIGDFFGTDERKRGAIEQTQAQELSCAEPAESPESRIERLSKKVSEAMGTAYAVAIDKRDGDKDSFVSIECKTCYLFAISCASESEPGAIEAAVDSHVDSNLRSRKSDWPFACRCVDGLTQKQCLERFTAQQREDVRSKRGNLIRPRDGAGLNLRQSQAARSAWSAELKRLQTEAREKERHQVQCQDQWGDDETW